MVVGFPRMGWTCELQRARAAQPGRREREKRKRKPTKDELRP
jgi:hypothetical protein